MSHSEPRSSLGGTQRHPLQDVGHMASTGYPLRFAASGLNLTTVVDQSNDWYPAHMSENQSSKQVHIGPKMRQMWTYVKEHPGELEYAVRVQFGRSGREIINRLVEADMISIVENRCYVKDDRAVLIKRSEATKDHNRIRQYSYDLALQVPCTNRECLAEVDQPCTGQTRYKQDRIGPHYERYVVLAYCIAEEKDQLARENAQLKAHIANLEAQLSELLSAQVRART